MIKAIKRFFRRAYSTEEIMAIIAELKDYWMNTPSGSWEWDIMGEHYIIRYLVHQKQKPDYEFFCRLVKKGYMHQVKAN